MSDARTYYDDLSPTLSNPGQRGFLASPGGLVTGTANAVTWPSGGHENWATRTLTAYDAFGRSTSATNGDGDTTKTRYTPGFAPRKSIELPTTIAVTNPKGWTTTSGLDQARQLLVKVADVNGEVTSEAYDPLGRLTAVTTRADQNTRHATYRFSYSLTGHNPAAVITQTLMENGRYSQDVKIYDGMLQLRQEQGTPPNNSGGRLITDTDYDSHGSVVRTSNPYYNAGPPSMAMFMPRSGATPGQIATSYDGQGRVIRSQFLTGNSSQWQTTTSYPGMDETDVTPPPGGTAASVFTDALGRTAASWQYTTAAPTAHPADADVTSYTYTPAGQTSAISDNNGNTWTYAYDLLGQETSATDPGAAGNSGPSHQAGTTTFSYDPAGNLTSQTSPLGQNLSWTYDSLGRQIRELSGTAKGTLLATWTYDTAPLGRLKTRGQLAAATTFDASGRAYTEAVTGYNSAYQATGTATTIPAAALKPGAKGTDRYTTANGYFPLTGLLESTNYSAEGGLPRERVSYSYAGDLLAASTGKADYLDDVIYTPQGQPERTTFGPYRKQLVLTYNHDPATQRLEQSTTNLQPLSRAPDVTSYRYDPAGNVTAVSDSQSVGGTQTQCFGYDNLDQLTTAWTATGGLALSSGFKVGDIGGCARQSPLATTIGGPAPYWQTYGYDLLGDRISETSYDTALPAS